MKPITFGPDSHFLFYLGGNHLESSAAIVLAHQLRKRGCKLCALGSKTEEILKSLGHELFDCRKLFDGQMGTEGSARWLLPPTLNALWTAEAPLKKIGLPTFSGLCCTLPDLRPASGIQRGTYGEVSQAVDLQGQSLISFAIHGSRVVVTDEKSINKLIRHLQGLQGVETSTVEAESIPYYLYDATRFLANRMAEEASWRYGVAINAEPVPA